MSARNPLLTPEEEAILEEARKIRQRLKAREDARKKADPRTPEEKERIRQQYKRKQAEKTPEQLQAEKEKRHERYVQRTRSLTPEQLAERRARERAYASSPERKKKAHEQYLKNREKAIAAVSEKYQKDRQASSAKSAEYYQQHKEEIKERVAANTRRANAVKRGYAILQDFGPGHCPICGRKIENPNATYCCRTCYYLARKQTRVCEVCGRRFPCQGSSHKTTCSTPCYNVLKNKKGRQAP